MCQHICESFFRGKRNMLYDPKRNRIRQLRVAKGIDARTDLAKAIKDAFGVEMTSMTIGRMENGEVKPRFDLIYAMAKFFDVSIEYLMGISDDPHGDGRRRLNDNNKDQDDTPPEVKMAMETLKKQLVTAIKAREDQPSETL